MGRTESTTLSESKLSCCRHLLIWCSIETVTNDEFEAFLKVLISLRGSFLEKVTTDADRILKTIRQDSLHQVMVVDEQSATPRPIPHELRELFGCLEPEMTLQ